MMRDVRVSEHRQQSALRLIFFFFHKTFKIRFDLIFFLFFLRLVLFCFGYKFICRDMIIRFICSSVRARAHIIHFINESELYKKKN